MTHARDDDGRDPIDGEEAPRAERRAASARFEVDPGIGSQAAMHEAMDPAHRSLAEALQLTFRALQVAIIVLLVLFAVSGFRTIGDGQSGVATIWGRIVEPGALATGPVFNWPAPVGEFVVFNAEKRFVDTAGAFMPRITGAVTRESRIDRATAGDPLRPERDGSLLTAEGDLMHLRLSGRYEIVDPVPYVRRVDDTRADDIVRVTLQRAAVHVAARHELHELIEMSAAELKELLRDEAQTMLSGMTGGVRLAEALIIEQPQPPLFIQKAYSDYINAKVETETSLEQAGRDAKEILITSAGSGYKPLLDMIDTYEAAWELEDDEASEAMLARIDDFLESDQVAGEAASILNDARGFLADIETTLGSEALRFASLLPAFQAHPELTVRKRWLEAYERVLARPDVEIYQVPDLLGTMRLDLTGLDSVQQMRRRAAMQRRERAARTEGLDRVNPFIRRARDIRLSGPGRQLDVEDGRVAPRGP